MTKSSSARASAMRPVVNDQAVFECLATIFMGADLGRCQHVSAVFNGARAQQTCQCASPVTWVNALGTDKTPARLPARGTWPESAYHNKSTGRATRHPPPPCRLWCRPYSFATRCTAIRQGDIEHANFVIARRNCAVGRKNQRAIDSRVIFTGQKL